MSETPLAVLVETVARAWRAIDGHRGISASVLVGQCRELLTHLGDGETLKLFDAAPYSKYGAPKIAVICRRYGLDIPDDIGVQRMVLSEPCSDYCDLGC